MAVMKAVLTWRSVQRKGKALAETAALRAIRRRMADRDQITTIR